MGHLTDRLQDGYERQSRLACLPHCLTAKEHLASYHALSMAVSRIRWVATDTLQTFRSRPADALVGRSPSMSPVLVLLLAKPMILGPAYYFAGAQSSQTLAAFY